MIACIASADSGIAHRWANEAVTRCGIRARVGPLTGVRDCDRCARCRGDAVVKAKGKRKARRSRARVLKGQLRLEGTI